MKKTILVNLMPKGRFSVGGYYNRASNAWLRFDISLDKCEGQDYSSLESISTYSFSMCGSADKNSSGDQGIERLIDEYGVRIPPDQANDIYHLLDIWRRYHLNNMHPGTLKQERAIESWEKREVGYSYTAASDYLKSIGLYKDRGYKYGTGWLICPIPAYEVKFIIDLHSI